jgi:hypothetical protein
VFRVSYGLLESKGNNRFPDSPSVIGLRVSSTGALSPSAGMVAFRFPEWLHYAVLMT